MSGRAPRRDGRRGHPAHAMLSAFPVSLWVVGTGWDLVALLRPEPIWHRMAFWTLATGLLLALPTIATGLWELARLPAARATEATAWRHLACMGSAFALFLASVALRRGDLANPPAGLAIGLAIAGVALTLAGGWLGGELVFRHGVGVESRREPDRP